MKNRIITLSSISLLIIASLTFVYKNIMGFGFLQFTDESGHFLGAMAIHHGDILYRDYIDAHGPLVFILTWLVGLIVGYSKVAYLRAVSSLCALCASYAIFSSPLFKETWQKCLATSIWIGMLSNIWIVQGLYLDSYWPIAGSLVIITLSTLIIPLTYGLSISISQAFWGGFAISLLPFTAYSFAPISLLFIFVILLAYFYQKPLYFKTLIASIIGGLSAFIITIIWLLIYGDIGGMIAFHFIANQIWYAHYIPLNIHYFIQSIFPSFDMNKLIGSLAIICFVLNCIFLFYKSAYKTLALLTLISILTLQIRGGFLFQNGSFVMVSIATLSLTLIYYLKNISPILCILMTIILPITTMIVSRHALSSPSMMTLTQRQHVQWYPFQKSHSKEAHELRQYVKPDERVLALPYNPDFYIYLNRLPISKYHAYLPWEADYAAHPWHGYTRDLCVDLPKEMPPLIYFDNWIVWNAYAPKQFMPCIFSILHDHYTKLPNDKNIYIRNDRFNSNNHK